MVVQFVRYTFSPENSETAAAMLRELREASRGERGVVTFDIARSGDDANAFVLWELYESEAAIEEHKATEHFRRLVLEGIRTLAKSRAVEVFTSI